MITKILIVIIIFLNSKFCIYPDGGYYNGEWKENKKNGQGEHHSRDGTVYKGEWLDNQKNGQGTMIFANGVKKTGIWENNNFKG